MSQKCNNCSTAITCGCQIRTATDGKKVCSKCVTSYEVYLKTLGQSTNSIVITKAAIFPNG